LTSAIDENLKQNYAQKTEKKSNRDPTKTQVWYKALSVILERKKNMHKNGKNCYIRSDGIDVHFVYYINTISRFFRHVAPLRHIIPIQSQPVIEF
jgi:hypothetical protein